MIGKMARMMETAQPEGSDAAVQRPLGVPVACQSQTIDEAGWLRDTTRRG